VGSLARDWRVCAFHCWEDMPGWIPARIRCAGQLQKINQAYRIFEARIYAERWAHFYHRFIDNRDRLLLHLSWQSLPRYPLPPWSNPQVLP
jgi:hypothetical protein